MHLLLRQTLPTEALVLLLDGVSGPSMELFHSGVSLISDSGSPVFDSDLLSPSSDLRFVVCDLRYSIFKLQSPSSDLRFVICHLRAAHKGYVVLSRN